MVFSLAMPAWPLGVFIASAVVMAAGTIFISHVLGQRHRDRMTVEPYESGIVPTESARLRIPVRFYMLAIFFVVFDVEAVFIFAWAVAVRELGWGGYLAILSFIALLLLALAYLWRQGALEWSTPPDARGDSIIHAPQSGREKS